MTSLDRQIVEFLYRTALGTPALRILAVFWGHWSGYLLIPLFLYFAYRTWRRTMRLMVFWNAVIAAAVSRIFLELIRVLTHIQRPFNGNGFSPLFSPSENGFSFPSGHATFYFALATVAWYESRPIGALFFAAALLMGVGRITAGVHWPSDVLAGAVLGIGTAYLTRRSLSR